MAHTAVSKASIVFTIPLNGVMTQLNIPGKIMSVVKGTSDKSFNQFCPDCQQQIHLQVHCPNDHGPIDRTTLLKGRLVDDQIVIVEDADDVKASDIAKGKLTVKAVTRDSLVEGTTSSGKPYHFVPDPGDATDREAYAILYSAVTDNPDWAFVCRANIGRGAETLLSVEQGAFGGLTLQTLAFPETLYDLPEYEVEEMSKANKSNIRTLLADQVESFDPDEWLDRQAAAVAAAVTEAAKAPTRKGEKAKAKKVKDTTPTLLSAIAAAAKAS